MSFPWKFEETKYLRILKIYGSEDFKEHKIQLPGFYTLYSPFWAWNLSTSTTQRGGTIYPHPQVLGILKAPIFCNMCSVTSSWNWQPFSLKSVTSFLLLYLSKWSKFYDTCTLRTPCHQILRYHWLIWEILLMNLEDTGYRYLIHAINFKVELIEFTITWSLRIWRKTKRR